MICYVLVSLCSCWHADTENDGDVTQGEVGGRNMTTTYAYVGHRLGQLAGFFPLSKLVGWDRMGIGRKVRRWRYRFFRNGQDRTRALALAIGCMCLSDVE